MTMAWNYSYLLGIEKFDEHHKHLFDLLNKAHSELVNGESDKNVRPLLDELADYATYHFAAEEYWMEEFSYPGLIQHKNEHSKFFEKVVQMLNDYDAGTTSPMIEILTFLHNWITIHILQSDADYGKFYFSTANEGKPHPPVYS